MKKLVIAAFILPIFSLSCEKARCQREIENGFSAGGACERVVRNYYGRDKGVWRKTSPIVRRICVNKRNCQKLALSLSNDFAEHDIQSLMDKTGSSTFEEIKMNEEKEVNKRLKPVEIKEGIYTCKKCGGKRTQSYEVQLRRADEPATVFIECVNPKCRNKWSIN